MPVDISNVEKKAKKTQSNDGRFWPPRIQARIVEMGVPVKVDKKHMVEGVLIEVTNGPLKGRQFKIYGERANDPDYSLVDDLKDKEARKTGAFDHISIRGFNIKNWGGDDEPGVASVYFVQKMPNYIDVKNKPGFELDKEKNRWVVAVPVRIRDNDNVIRGFNRPVVVNEARHLNGGAPIDDIKRVIVEEIESARQADDDLIVLAYSPFSRQEALKADRKEIAKIVAENKDEAANYLPIFTVVNLKSDNAQNASPEEIADKILSWRMLRVNASEFHNGNVSNDAVSATLSDIHEALSEMSDDASKGSVIVMRGDRMMLSPKSYQKPMVSGGITETLVYVNKDKDNPDVPRYAGFSSVMDAAGIVLDQEKQQDRAINVLAGVDMAMLDRYMNPRQGQDQDAVEASKESADAAPAEPIDEMPFDSEDEIEDIPSWDEADEEIAESVEAPPKDKKNTRRRRAARQKEEEASDLYQGM